MYTVCSSVYTKKRGSTDRFPVCGASSEILFLAFFRLSFIRYNRIVAEFVDA